MTLVSSFTATPLVDGVNKGVGYFFRVSNALQNHWTCRAWVGVIGEAP